MDQHIGNELPPLDMEKTHAPGQMEQVEFAGGMERTEQQAAQAIETNSQAGAMPPLPVPTQTQYQQSPQPAAQLPAADSNPVIADDADLIEKEWILKAKEIVARTKHDPYQQNKEVEKMKADYMRKRYNKDIKTTED